MRDVVTHAHTIDFDLNRLWEVTTTKLAELQDRCEKRLAELDAELGQDPNPLRKDRSIFDMALIALLALRQSTRSE